MVKSIAVLPGDGIGPEVIKQALKVLKAVEKKFKHSFSYQYGLIGAAALAKTGKPLPAETLKLCQESEVILFGAVGDPAYDQKPSHLKPEQGILQLRKALDLYANLRPIKTYKALLDKSPLKKEIIKETDILIIRELVGGIYFGQRGRQKNGQMAFDTAVYQAWEITRVAKLAFQFAQKRRQKVTVVDKANVLETSRLWREVVNQVALDFPQVTLEFMYVDNASMQLMKKPTAFDVILTENMFGDILSDEASVITASLGMIPSASIGTKTALFEPIHGSYPKAAGKNIANPLGAILAAAMMLDYWHLEKEALSVFQAVEKSLNQGLVTQDLKKINHLTTEEVGNKISSLI